MFFFLKKKLWIVMGRFLIFIYFLVRGGEQYDGTNITNITS